VQHDHLAGRVKQPRDALELVEKREPVADRLGQAGEVCLLLKQPLACVLQAPAAVRDGQVARLHGLKLQQRPLDLLV